MKEHSRPSVNNCVSCKLLPIISIILQRLLLPQEGPISTAGKAHLLCLCRFNQLPAQSMVYKLRMKNGIQQAYCDDELGTTKVITNRHGVTRTYYGG